MTLVSSSKEITASAERLELISAPSIIIAAVTALSSDCSKCYGAVASGDHAGAAAAAASAIDYISLLETVRLSMGQCDVRDELTSMMISLSSTFIDLVSIAHGGDE